MTTPSSIEERIARLEGSFDQIERRLGTLEQDLRSLRAEINARFDRLETRIDRLMYWQLGLLGAIAAAIVAIVLTRLL
jgi:chromosome segregation ATPase